MPVALINALEKKLDNHHLFLRDHAKAEETALVTIDKTLAELLSEAKSQTQSGIRLADVTAERWDEEKEARRAKRETEAELTKLELEQRGKVGAFFQAQWNKYGIVAIVVIAVSFAPQLAPLLFQYLGMAPQQVQVVAAPQPDPVVPVAAPEEEP